MYILFFLVLCYDFENDRFVCFIFFCQAEDGIRDLVRSRGLGDVYKRQVEDGKLDLDAPVRTWLPDLRLCDDGVAQRVTLRHLSLIHI